MQLRVLVGGVYRLAHKKANVGGVLQQHSGNLGGGVASGLPVGGDGFRRGIAGDDVQRPAQGDDALRHQINAPDAGGGRDIWVHIIVADYQLTTQTAADHLSRAAAADNMGPFAGQKLLQKAFVVLLLFWRPYQQVDGLASPHFEYRHSHIVGDMLQIQVPAGVGQPGGQAFGRHFGAVNLLQVILHALALPAVWNQPAQAGMGDAVGHQYKNVASLQGKAAFHNGFIPQNQPLRGVIHAFSLAQQDGQGVVILR